MRHIIVEFVEIVAVRIDRRDLRFFPHRVFEESPYNLSHNSSPLSWIFEEENTIARASKLLAEMHFNLAYSTIVGNNGLETPVQRVKIHRDFHIYV
jgi:hypothetical protein